MRNRHFLVLLAAFGIGLGMFNALTTLVEQLVAPFCYNEGDASLFAGLLLGCGLLSAGVVGVYLDKSHRYKFVLKILFSLATATILLYSLLLRPNARAGLAVTFCNCGWNHVTHSSHGAGSSR
jgi:FLVCR family MFS transporter 7